MYVVKVVYDGDTQEWEYTRPEMGGPLNAEHLSHRQSGRGLGTLQRALEQDTVGPRNVVRGEVREEKPVGRRVRKAPHPDSSSE